MARAEIRIAQAGVQGAPGRSRDDLITGSLVTLSNADDNGVTSWRWLLVNRPRFSSATLSNVVAAQPTFTPDVEGSYLIQLTVNSGLQGEVDRVIGAVRFSFGGFDVRYPAAAETDEANWQVDLGAGPVENTTGWWEDFDRWLRALQAGGSGPPPSWSAVLSAGNVSGANDAAMVNERRLIHGTTIAGAEGTGSSWRTSRKRTNPGAGNGLVNPMGTLLCDVGVTASRIVVAKLAGVMQTATDLYGDGIEEIWDLDSSTLLQTVYFGGEGRFSFTSPGVNQLAVNVFERLIDPGPIYSYVMVDISRLPLGLS